MTMCHRLNHPTNSHKLKWIGGEGATTCNLSNSAPSGRRDNFAAFGVEEMLDRFTRVFIILNDQDAGFFFSIALQTLRLVNRSSDSSTPREQT